MGINGGYGSHRYPVTGSADQQSSYTTMASQMYVLLVLLVALVLLVLLPVLVLVLPLTLLARVFQVHGPHRRQYWQQLGLGPWRFLHGAAVRHVRAWRHGGLRQAQQDLVLARAGGHARLPAAPGQRDARGR